MSPVIGIDHLYIAVSDLAHSEAFYDRALVTALGFRKNRFSLNGDPHIQYFNRHFGFVIRPAWSEAAHDPYAPGLHHFCLRVESIADVEAAALALKNAGIPASPARHHPDYAEDYWAVFFEDPDSIRLEITNYRKERKARFENWEE
jgi:glyoxylase I family protein